MPTPPSASRPSTLKRDHLVETAFSLFYREGYHAVGIDKILRTAGLAKMTLYHHFKSKEELIVAALERRGVEIRELRQRNLASAGSSPRQQLLALFAAYEAWFNSPDFNGCAFIRAIGEFPAATSPVHQTATAEKQILIQTLESLLTELKVKRPDRVSLHIYLLIEGGYHQRTHLRER
ncbi:MAG: TetR/AcrR family transcriptional regulator [Candidatus Synoicihabitans palmerolidicus]|nr:TetR/AcrR family transcriptional regulator [Candidatus Synoicihabitans palmerolidicus]